MCIMPQEKGTSEEKKRRRKKEKHTTTQGRIQS